MFALSGAQREKFLDEARELIVCDEAHLLPDELISRGTIDLSQERHSIMQKLYGSSISIKLPDFTVMDDRRVLQYMLSDYKNFVCSKLVEIDEKLEAFEGSRHFSKNKQKLFK